MCVFIPAGVKLIQRLKLDLYCFLMLPLFTHATTTNGVFCDRAYPATAVVPCVEFDFSNAIVGSDQPSLLVAGKRAPVMYTGFPNPCASPSIINQASPAAALCRFLSCTRDKSAPPDV